MESITVAAAPEQLDAVQEFVAQCGKSANLPPACSMRIALVVEEVFINIAHYAYGEGAGKADISCWTAPDGAFYLRFSDEGIPYDPLAKDDPDITLSAEEREVGGLGIFLMKQIMDDVAYRRENGRNILEMHLHCGK